MAWRTTRFLADDKLAAITLRVVKLRPVAMELWLHYDANNKVQNGVYKNSTKKKQRVEGNIRQFHTCFRYLLYLSIQTYPTSYCNRNEFMWKQRFSNLMFFNICTIVWNRDKKMKGKYEGNVIQGYYEMKLISAIQMLPASNNDCERGLCHTLQNFVERLPTFVDGVAKSTL
uniref:Uncharacterized protein n=1 Tax=Strigamia maritima TaxID=126957 RepID=T1JNS6_STRMM